MIHLPDFTPALDDRLAAEFLAHTLTLLPVPLRQDAAENQHILDSWALRFIRPEPPRDPDLPLLAPKAYPRPDATLIEAATRALVPLSAIEHFTGHKTELDNAVIALMADHPVVISGGHGSGKTALLRQLAQDKRIRKGFKRVWWLDDLDSAGITLGLALNAPGVLRADHADKPRRIREFLSGVLLLIDEVDNADDLDWALALAPAVAVIAPDTAIPKTPITRITLGGLPPEAGVELLAAAAHDGGKETRPLAESVGYLPGSLALLAALIAEDGIPPTQLADFLAGIDGDRLEALYKASFDALPEQYQAVCRGFAAAPRRWIALDTVLNSFGSPLIGGRALTFLEKRGFIERTETAVRVTGLWPGLITPAEVGYPPLRRPADQVAMSEGSAEARTLHEQGITLMNECRDEEAETALNRALTLRGREDTDHAVAETLVALARLAYLRGDDGTAIKRLEAAAERLHQLRDDESLSVARVALSRVYRRTGRLDAALSVLDDSAPEDLIAVYRAREEWIEALAVYQQHPDQDRFGLAETYALAGQYAEALAVVADVEDDDFAANWIRAVVYHMQGDTHTALEIYNQMSNDAPPEWRSTLARARARALASEGEIQEAGLLVGAEGSWYENKLPRPIFARQRSSLALYAHLCRMLGKLDEADSAARRALDLPGECPQYEAEAIAHRVLARLAWGRGETNAALSEFDAELTALGKIQPRDEHEVGVVLHNIADLQVERREADRAIANYRRTLTHKDPTIDRYSVALTRLALRELLTSTGRTAESLEAGAQAIELLQHPPEADLRILGYAMGLQAGAQRDFGRTARGDAVFSEWLARLADRAEEGIDHPYPGVQLLAIGLLMRSLPADLSALDPVEWVDLAEKALHTAGQNNPSSWVEGAARRDLGNLYLRLERWADAYEVFEPLFGVDAPFLSLAAHLGAARAAIRQEQPDLALEHFDMALPFEPDPHARGLILRESAEYCRSIAHDEEAADRYAASLNTLAREQVAIYVDTLVALAYTRLRLLRFAEAIDTFEAALEIAEKRSNTDPALMASVLIDMATAHHTLGQYRRAVATFKRALSYLDMRHDPVRFIDTLAALARSNVALEAYQAALEAYHDALSFESIDPGLRRTLLIEQAAIFFRVAQFDAAIVAYNMALAISDASPVEIATVHRGLGAIYARRDEHQSARTHFEAALSAVQDDQTGLTLAALADGHKAQNQAAEAIDGYLSALVYLDGGGYPVEAAAAHRALGELYIENGRAFDALTQLESALEIERALPQQDGGRIVLTLQFLAQAHELRGELDRAALRHHAALVYQDVRHVPDKYVDTLLTLGRLYTQMKRYPDAIKAYDEALSAESRQPNPTRVDEITGLLGDTYRTHGRLEVAAELYQKVAAKPAQAQTAQALKATQSDIARHLATLEAAEQSWAVLNRVPNPELKGLAFIRALQAKTYAALGRWDESETYLEKMLNLLRDRRAELLPDSPELAIQALAMLLQGHELEESRQYEPAGEAYSAALKIVESDPKSDPSLLWAIRQKAGRTTRR